MTITLKQMMDAGMHLGHKTWKWNPKMKPFIYTEQNHLHIIDLIKTSRYLTNALKFLTHSASDGKTILFVGTKKQAKNLIASSALSCKSFYVNEKWVGGILTNWKTFETSTEKLRLLEKQEKNGFLEKLPKKEMAKKLKEKEKLTKHFNGIKHMKELPDIVIIIGQSEEMNALNECNKLGIRSISLVDTNCNPLIADLIIPANDDSMLSIKLVLDEFVTAIQKGQTIFDQKKGSRSKQSKKRNKK